MKMELSRTTLRGVWPALLLPWTDNDELDEARFRAEVRAYAGTGVHGVYTGGTTGEFYAQDDATFQKITAIACEEAHAIGLPVQIGCTALATRTVCGRVKFAVAAGADGIQIALPFWLEMKDDEVATFFDRVVDVAGDTSLIFYHTSRAKRTLGPRFLADLAVRHPTLIGMKDTVSPISFVRELLDLVPDFAILGGEHHLLERIAAGGRGTFSSVALLNARYVAEFYAAIIEGRIVEAERRQNLIQRYFNEAVIPLVRDEGLWDSAADRVQRVAGGFDIGLRCQGPYRSASDAHVERLRRWCREQAPEMLGHEDRSKAVPPSAGQFPSPDSAEMKGRVS
jgi:dihydrodipicolinate synthase/N-acetylneuraminate lyase